MNFLFRGPSLAVLTCAGELHQHETVHLAHTRPCPTPPPSWAPYLGVREGNPLPRPTCPQPLPSRPPTRLIPRPATPRGPRRAPCRPQCTGTTASTAPSNRTRPPTITTTTTTRPSTSSTHTSTTTAPMGGSPPTGPMPTATRRCPRPTPATRATWATPCTTTGSPLPRRPSPAARPNPAASAQLCRQPGRGSRAPQSKCTPHRRAQGRQPQTRPRALSVSTSPFAPGPDGAPQAPGLVSQGTNPPQVSFSGGAPGSVHLSPGGGPRPPSALKRCRRPRRCRAPRPDPPPVALSSLLPHCTRR